ncbi:MAG: universal stress protein [Actinomycetota bacterium]|nr:universal stress protein [Actinomycetota bacterium]
MGTTTILCIDGSDLSIQAARSGLEVLRDADSVVVATVIELADASLVTGTSGFAGGTVSPETLDGLREDQMAEGESIVAQAVEALGLGGATTHVLSGHAGQVLCNLAADLDATSIVIGSRGRGGIKRAVLGSVSDHVVRNAPCPVVVIGPGADD